MDKIKTDQAALRKFGLTMALCFAVLTLVIFLKRKNSVMPALLISLSFFLLAFSAPVFLKYIYVLWMKLAFILGWVNNRLLLGVIFYFVFLPIGLIIRFLRIDLLEIKLERACNSYWKRKEKKDFSPADYERQF